MVHLHGVGRPHRGGYGVSLMELAGILVWRS